MSVINEKQRQNSEVEASYNDKYEYYDLPECDAVYFIRLKPMFLMNILAQHREEQCTNFPAIWEPSPGSSLNNMSLKVSC